MTYKFRDMTVYIFGFNISPISNEDSSIHFYWGEGKGVNFWKNLSAGYHL